MGFGLMLKISITTEVLLFREASHTSHDDDLGYVILRFKSFRFKAIFLTSLNGKPLNTKGAAVSFIIS